MESNRSRYKQVTANFRSIDDSRAVRAIAVEDGRRAQRSTALHTRRNIPSYLEGLSPAATPTNRGVAAAVQADEARASNSNAALTNNKNRNTNSRKRKQEELIELTNCANCMHTASAPVNEVYIKEEPIYDAQASTSQKQHLMIKAEKYFDIKHEPLSSEDENCNLNLVEDSSDADHPSAILSTSGLKKALQCSECDYETVYKGNFIFHLQKHSKPYVCSDCNYKTDRPANLKIHMRTHTGEKPFECSECNYKTARKGHLKTHMRTHTGDKPFECSECNYKTAHTGTLKAHMRTHTGDKPFKCSLCSYKASNRSSLTWHLKTHSTLSVASGSAIT